MGKRAHIFVIAPILTLAAIATTDVAAEFVKANVTIGHGPNRPSSVPILPCLNAGRSMFFGPIPSPVRQGDYEPVEGGYSKHNGDRAFNYIITSGAWLLRAGDKPRISITLRSGLQTNAGHRLAGKADSRELRGTRGEHGYG